MGARSTEVKAKSIGLRGAFLALLASLAAVGLITGCGDDDNTATGAEEADAANSDPGLKPREEIEIQYVFHGVASDPFFNVIRAGVDQAAKDYGVNVEYHGTEVYDPREEARLVEAAIAKEPDAIVASVPDPDVLIGPIKSAVDAGIPVVLANIGRESREEIGALVYVGENHYQAGFQAGVKFAEAGVTKALCVNHTVGVVALDLRCDGFTKGFEGETELLAVDGEDPTDVRNRISSKLTSDPAINGVFTLGPPAAEPGLDAIEESGRADEITMATFDLTPKVLEAIRDERMLFANDQQPWLQGYMPIALLTNYVQYGLMPVDDIITGAAFVTPENAADVIALSEKAIR